MGVPEWRNKIPRLTRQFSLAVGEQARCLIQEMDKGVIVGLELECNKTSNFSYNYPKEIFYKLEQNPSVLLIYAL